MRTCALEISGMRSKLKRIIEHSDTRAGKIQYLAIQALILISVVSFMFETLPDLDPLWVKTLRVIEVFCVIVFTIEYILRIYVSDRPFRFIFSIFGIFDLLAIVPFYLATGIDWRSLRAFRFLRIFQIFKLSRYSKAMRRFVRALRLIREEFTLFLIITFILIFFSAIGIYYLEREAQPEVFTSVFESLWWAISTLTTVGYGDIYPVTAGGKIFTYFILIIGIAIIAIPAGLISSAMVEIRREDHNVEEALRAKREKEIRDALTK